MKIQPLVYPGSELFVVTLDENDPDTIAIEVAYTMAKQAAVSVVRRQGKIDADVLRRLAGDIAGRLQYLKELRTHLGNVAKNQENAMHTLNWFERKITQLVDLLDEQLPGAGNGDYPFLAVRRPASLTSQPRWAA